MKTTIKLISGAAILLASLSGQAIAQETIKVGMSGKYFPFTFVKQDKLQGFEVDMWNQIGERTGYKVEFVTASFSGLFGMLETGRVDTISNQITITDERKAKYAFSQPYVYDGAQIVVRKGNSTIHGLKDLEGKTVAVNLGSNFEELLRKNDPNKKIDIRTYDSAFEQDVALGRHASQRLGVVHLGVAELADGGAISLQRFGGLLQVGEVLFGQFCRQAVEVFQRIVDGVQRWLLRLGLAAVGVAAHLIARLLQQLAQFDHAVELRDAVTLQHGFLDFRDFGHGIVGTGAELAAGVFALHGGLGHVGKSAFVFGNRSQLLVDHRHIGRLLDHAACRLQAAFEFAQEFVDRARSLLAATHVVVHARQAQVLGQLIEAGDKTEFVTAADDAAHAGPAGEGDQQCQQQHQAETDAQLAFDADVSKTLG